MCYAYVAEGVPERFPTPEPFATLSDSEFPETRFEASTVQPQYEPNGILLNFDGVLMEGMGIGPVGPEDVCDPATVGWAVFHVGYLIDFPDSQEVRFDLIQRTSIDGLRKQWYLCRNAGP